MTAEIAILNKLAVALATDSAVTITTGNKEEKIYDSGDKLFELSLENPIGIMIYNGLNFMQAPLPMLIAEYRRECIEFDRVEGAGYAFLCYLNDWGRTCSPKVATQALAAMVLPVFERIRERTASRIEEVFSKFPLPDDPQAELRKIQRENLGVFTRILTNAPDASFIGGPPPLDDPQMDEVKALLRGYFSDQDAEFWPLVVELGRLAVLKHSNYSATRTGIVIAGFGSKDIFPSLVSYEVDGIAFGNLRFRRTNFIDIDRDGDRARVLPFAQKEMVERFLYGLDTDIERNIAQFCTRTVSSIRKEILEQIDAEPEDIEHLAEKARQAEQAFLQGLKDSSFEEIRSSSRKAIEDMVEFMPKPELATMAEALVNLTSIKRRVSRGMETVGGPIDVGIISRSDGFIWVKRKHYFSAEMNLRYVHRVRSTRTNKGKDHEHEHGSGSAGEAGRGTPRRQRARSGSRRPSKGH